MGIIIVMAVLPYLQKTSEDIIGIGSLVHEFSPDCLLLVGSWNWYVARSVASDGNYHLASHMWHV